MKRLIQTYLSAFLFISSGLSAAETPPNIVFILADDMGYGDVQSYNPERGKIPTPHMDQLVKEGMKFTDAHTTSSVCTPTRYGILTGRYNWRTHLQSHVLFGYSPPLISSERATVASFLKEHNYHTACVGKWHLGMTLPTLNDSPITSEENATNIDWEGTIKNGPINVGFDYFYGISASLDMPPYIYLLNDRFVGECTIEKTEFGREGAAHADFKAVDVLPEIGNKSVAFIQEQKKEQPFFLYVPLTSPHAPIIPSKEWIGKSGLGEYGDFQMQTDSIIGQIAKAVDDSEFAENPLLIVTSDNGCSRRANFKDLAKKGHYPNAQFRGAKSDLWDGGHRIPFIVRWPAKVKANTTSNELICQSDLMATCADILGKDLAPQAGVDSESFLPALLGKPIESKRKGLVHHSIDGHFSYRHGKWKLLLSRGSGGWTKPEEEVPEDNPKGQLYDMESDPSETTNLYLEKPEIVAELLAFLKNDVKRGRSTPGPDQTNDAKIKIWK